MAFIKREQECDMSDACYSDFYSLPLLPAISIIAPPPPPHAIVVGAGLAGLAVSIGLAKLGWTVDLVERRRDWSARGATLGVRLNGIQALHEICDTVVPSLLAQPEPTRGGLLTTWSAVRDALRKPVEEGPFQNQISLHMGMSLLDIVDDDGTGTGTNNNNAKFVQARFQKVSDAEDTESGAGVVDSLAAAAEESSSTASRSASSLLVLRGSLLLGCDGVDSAVRNLHLHLPPAEWTGVVWWRSSVTVPINAEDAPHCSRLLGKGVIPFGMPKYGPCTFSVFNFHPSVPRTLAWAATCKVPPNTEITPGTNLWTILDPHVTDETERSVLQELFSLSPVCDLSHVLSLRTVNPTVGATYPRCVSRVVLLGDAAHAMRPASGLGASLAFEDCVVFCRTVASVVAEQADILAAQQQQQQTHVHIPPWHETRSLVSDMIARYEAERLPRVTKIWNHEWETSEAAYSRRAENPVTTKDYNDWVHAGV